MRELNSPWLYLAVLCELQGVKYRVDGGTFHMSAGTIVLPVAPHFSSFPVLLRLSPIANVVRFGDSFATGKPVNKHATEGVLPMHLSPFPTLNHQLRNVVCGHSPMTLTW